MSKSVKKSAWILLVVGVLATFLMPQCTFIVTPGLSSLAERYPDVAYSNILMLQTMVNLLVIPFAMISGMLASKKIMKYRTLGCIAALCILIGGCMPYFVQDHFGIMMAFRSLCGVGEGLAFPLGSTLIIEYFQGRRRSLVQGISMFVLNISGVIYQNVAGPLCLIDVSLIWLLHGFLIIPLVLMLLFLREPSAETRALGKVGREEAELENAEAHIEELDDSHKPKYSKRAFALTTAFCFWTMLYFVIVLNMSQAVEQLGLGDAQTAGLVGSFYMISGLTSAFTYPILFRTLKKWLTPVILVIGLIGLACFTFASNVPMCCAAEFCVGFSAFHFWPNAMRDYAAMVNKEGVAFYSGVFSALWNLGAVFGGYWVSGLISVTGSQNPRVYGVINLVAGAILIAVWIFFRLRRPQALEADYDIK